MRSRNKVVQKHRIIKNTKSRLRSATWDWGAPILVEEHKKGGLGGRDKFWTTNPGRGAPMGIGECLPSWEGQTTGGGGVACGEFSIEVTFETDVRWWELRGSHRKLRKCGKAGLGSRAWNEIEEHESRQTSTNGDWQALSQRRSADTGVGVTSAEFSIRTDNPDWGAQLGLGKLACLSVEGGTELIQRRMKQRSTDPDRGLWSACPSGGVRKGKEQNVPWNRKASI